MDHMWAANQLRVFVIKIDQLLKLASQSLPERVSAQTVGVTPDIVADELITLDPVMRDLMNAARPGYGDYVSLEDAQAVPRSADYWELNVKPWALRAIGIHTFGAEAAERLRPDSPDLAAENFHSWVWKAAAPMWEASSKQAAVLAAAQSVNARLQQKLSRRDTADAKLCREAFSLNDAVPGQPLLRFPGDQTSETWRSRQNGAMQLGAGCFDGIRNPAAHEHRLQLPDQVALEQIAAFSVLARWIEECTVEEHVAEAPEPEKRLP